MSPAENGIEQRLRALEREVFDPEFGLRQAKHEHANSITSLLGMKGLAEKAIEKVETHERRCASLWSGAFLALLVAIIGWLVSR